MDTLLTQHRKQLRDLQSLTTSKKKSASKKTRKAVNAECAQLEADMRARHEREIKKAIENPDAEAEAGAEADGAGEEDVNGGGGNVYVPPPDLDDEDETAMPTPPSEPQHQSRGKKPNRQKARLARRTAELVAAAEAAASEASSLPDLRKHELETMQRLMDQHGLVETQINPDGHCLYSAFAHCLGDGVVAGGYREARTECARFLRAHVDDFAPFLVDDGDEGDGGVEERATKVESTAEWGGQVEVLAMARRWGVVVNVLQAQGGRVRMNEDAAEEGKGKGEVWLAYYRHSFGLGEHYNALVLAKEEKSKK